MKGLKQVSVMLKTLFILIVTAPVLAGCWDSSNLESVGYVTAIGIDREDKEYVFYAQLIDLSTIAKTEGGGNKNSTPVWNGQGRGKTVYDAYDKVLRSAQSELSLEQLKVVVVRERAMSNMTEILDAINRVRVSRYTSWVFGTKDEIKDIFSSDRILERSQLHSMLYNPQQHMKSNTFVEPLNMQKFVAGYNEPTVTALLPSVQVTDNTWSRNKSSIKVEMIDGVFAFKGKKKQYYGRNQITGIRWFNPRFSRYLLPVQSAQGLVATVAVTESRHKVKVAIKQGKPAFTLHMRIKGELAETEGGMNDKDIIHATKTIIAEEMMQVFTEGVKHGDDLLNLDEQLFRYHYKEWKKINKKAGWQPQIGDLKVKVDFILKHAGSFQLE
ncbi:Spore germination protein A3 [Paenibacillus plantiphilus]|uniref:Spore germination protein A3 n=1 Tax=Paenibacillus plantiphilus TaxID=2905650 RepID=A0ABM9CX59_9BACL|nr:Ger(x)C family spore germination protein [Paenibacillus plantiphilus]CAH1225345.1 Spore germination protein A3 [Paenibacillus plantiphilus]